jgi:hypothetical protein
MTNEPKKQDLEQVKSEIGEILRRVDSLPVLDSRTADEIVGYDENGVPASVMPPSVASAQDLTDSAKDLDMEDWRKAFGDKIPPAVKEFLEYRHREWELGIENNLKADEEARAEQTRKQEE